MTVNKCAWPECSNDALSRSGNLNGALVCREHFRITNGKFSDDLTDEERSIMKTIGEAQGDPGLRDKNGKPIDLQDYEASQIVGVQIGSLGHKLWVCIDGIAVLRVNSPRIDFEDMRIDKPEPELNLTDEKISSLYHRMVNRNNKKREQESDHDQSREETPKHQLP